MEEYLQTAKQLAIKAGKEIIKIYHSQYDIEEKEDKSPLTTADKKANEVIVKGLEEKFPQHAILSEESQDKNRLDKDYVWIVDPLDGTKEFIKKNGEFTVNIALTYKQKPIVGVIYIPAKEQLFFASKDNGSFFNNKKIKTSSRIELKNMILIKSRSHASQQVKKFIKEKKLAEVKTSGSSLKGCLVAQGKADIYFRFGPTHEWDICAMDAILKEAGGKLTNLKGKKIKYNQEKTKINGFLASNNTIHKKLLGMIQ